MNSSNPTGLNQDPHTWTVLHAPVEDGVHVSPFDSIRRKPEVAAAQAYFAVDDTADLVDGLHLVKACDIPSPSLESMVSEDADGTLVTTSLIIATGTERDHKPVLRLVRDNLADFEEFGRVGFENSPFETAGGTQNRTYAVLNREHAMLLMTYMRNTEIVRAFKKNLIHAFVDLEKKVASPAELDRETILRMALEAETERKELESAVKELEAHANGLEKHNARLRPRADVADQFLTAQGDYSVSDAAKILCRAGADTGRNKLFQTLEDHNWIYRDKDRRPHARQEKINSGHLSVIVPKPYISPRTGIEYNGVPTIRVTPKGISRLGVIFGVVANPDREYPAVFE